RSRIFFQPLLIARQSAQRRCQQPRPRTAKQGAYCDWIDKQKRTMTPHQTLAEWSQWFWPIFANHLWQATLFAFVVWIAVTWLNQARARLVVPHTVCHSVWMMAFAKFLLPSVALILLARNLGLNISWPARTEMVAAADAGVFIQIAEPVTQTAQPNAVVGHNEVYCVLTAVWLIGAAACFARWLWRRRRMAEVVIVGEKVETGREA